MSKFDGLSVNLSNLHLLSNAKTRSICPENFTGEKGKGAMAIPDSEGHPSRDLGQGWKVSPCISINAGETFEIANIQGPGAVQQIWMTPTGNWRYSILRIYYDDQQHPAVECPLGDFFCSGWGQASQLSSLAVCVNPGSAFNCYWTMPFKKQIRMTVENIDTKAMRLFWQVNYALNDVPEDAAYLCAQFRRSNPLTYKQDHTLVDNIQGQGHYVGTYIAWGVNNTGWWGEGEIKFFMDDDTEFPTICGTGTEDYFCGSYNFENKKEKKYQAYTTPYAGLHEVIIPDGLYNSQQRFGMYRWHITDPIRFEKNLKVTIQALGWRSDGRFLPLQDDIASTTFWYQTLPTSPLHPLPDKDGLEVI